MTFTLPLWPLVLALLTGPVMARPHAQAIDSPEMVELRQIAAGRFLQGSPPSDPLRAPNEGPVRTVDVPSFSIGRFEVTVRQFRSFVEATGYVTDAEHDVPVGGAPAPGCFSHRLRGQPSVGWVPGRSWRNPGYPQHDGHPVVCVSWRDAQAYVSWLAQVTGRPFRLPSESEFEYARRGGTTSAWGWPDEATPCLQANLADRHLDEALPDWMAVIDCDDGHAFTAPVGAFRANLFGLHDMAGNVSEWTSDCWHADYRGAPANGGPWEVGGAEACSGRVLRGGDFASRPGQLRAAHRSWIPPEFRTYHAGFRVAVGRWE